jgi:hypothetical protein
MEKSFFVAGGIFRSDCYERKISRVVSSGKGKRAKGGRKNPAVERSYIRVSSKVSITSQKNSRFCIINSSSVDGISPCSWHSTNIRMNVLSSLAFLLLAAPALSRHDEYKILEGHQVRDDYHSPLPHTYIAEEDLPANFNWGNVNGRSYLTHSMNQHIPQCKSMQWKLEFFFDNLYVLNEAFYTLFSMYD